MEDSLRKKGTDSNESLLLTLKGNKESLRKARTDLLQAG